jgi:quercetin dioxygenase-like cupin family protein
MDIKKFFDAASMKHERMEDGIERFIYTGENIQVVEYHFPPNKVFPEHTHETLEQMGYLVSGKMGFMVGGEKKILMPGEFYHAPIGVVHNAWTLDEPSVLLDIFSPPRKDLM